MTMNKPRGLYIHVPFCLTKCPYCDFYSVSYSRSAAGEYASAVMRNLARYSEPFDTVYFGGGTPILAAEHIGGILSCANLTRGAEITVEANPCLCLPETLETLRKSGVKNKSFQWEEIDADYGAALLRGLNT